MKSIEIQVKSNEIHTQKPWLLPITTQYYPITYYPQKKVQRSEKVAIMLKKTSINYGQNTADNILDRQNQLYFKVRFLKSYLFLPL